MRKTMPLALAALVVALLAPTETRAALILYAQQDGVNNGDITEIASGADFTFALFNDTYGDFDIEILGTTSDNAATLSDLLSAAVTLTNTAAGERTITLYASQVNYSLPAGTPLSVESGLSGTVNTGTLSGSGVFQAYLDANNTALGSTFTNGPQNATLNGSTFDTGSAVGSFDRTNPLYSINSKAIFTVSAGGSGNFSSHVNVTAVPEPASGVLVLSGLLPAVGIPWLRRRRAKAQSSR